MLSFWFFANNFVPDGKRGMNEEQDFECLSRLRVTMAPVNMTAMMIIKMMIVNKYQCVETILELIDCVSDNVCTNLYSCLFSAALWPKIHSALSTFQTEVKVREVKVGKAIA